MSNVTKKPLSAKKTSSVTDTPDFFMNRLAVPKDLQEELAAKGLDYRWISYTAFTRNGNSHERGWAVYKRENTASTDSFLLGASPDGIIRRGDNVLAVRPLSYSRQHKEWLKQKTERQTYGSKAKAQELKEKIREAGVDSRVQEGFDEDEE